MEGDILGPAKVGPPPSQCRGMSGGLEGVDGEGNTIIEAGGRDGIRGLYPGQQERE